MMRRVQRGDTIIEVTIAFAIFSLAAVMSMQILSKGVATTQRDLELTLVRQQVDSQAEMLRYVRDTPALRTKVWADLTKDSHIVNSPASLSDSCTVSSERAFILKTSVDSVSQNTIIERQPVTAMDVKLVGGKPGDYTYAQMLYEGNSITGSRGVWIEAAQAHGSSVKAYDFYIHACWDSVGMGVPMTSGTIVRIYD